MFVTCNTAICALYGLSTIGRAKAAGRTENCKHMKNWQNIKGSKFRKENQIKEIVKVL